MPEEKLEELFLAGLDTDELAAETARALGWIKQGSRVKELSWELLVLLIQKKPLTLTVYSSYVASLNERGFIPVTLRPATKP